MDFTLSTYKSLINSLKDNNYKFFTVEEYFSLIVCSSLDCPLVILRHDIDRTPENALKMAKLEHELGLKATFYFRTIPQTFKPEIIKEIDDLGHEIGYHYENMARCNGNYEMAIEDFRNNLDKLREISPVYTICMHGSPLSQYDNRDLWKVYDYRDYGIIGEPYLNIDWDEVFYITDAGRAWNNENVSIRDKVDSNIKIDINSTIDIIKKSKSSEMPYQIMLNVHPHNWANNNAEWLKIFAWQGTKNIIKRVISNRHK